jgi:hypothetical protein
MLIPFDDLLREWYPKEKWLDADFRASWYKQEVKTRDEIIGFLQKRVERLEFEKQVLLKMLKERRWSNPKR